MSFQAMLLAAGKGTRLGELTSSIPKALVPVGGRPLLEIQLEYLAREGCSLVVVNAHHLADQIINFVASRQWDCEVQVVVEDTLLGTAGGLRNAWPKFDREEPVFVLYGDVMMEASLGPLSAFHAHQRADATIGVHWLENTRDKGLVELDGSYVTGFREKPVDPVPGWVNAGLYLLSPSLVEALPEAPSDFGHDVFPAALLAGRSLLAYDVGRALDIGTPANLSQAQQGRLPAQ